MLFLANMIVSLRNSKFKNNTKKAIAWRRKFAKVTLFAVNALTSVATAAGVIFQPQIIDHNFVHCTNPNDVLKLLPHHWSCVFAQQNNNKFLANNLLKGYAEHVVWNWNLSQPPDSRTIDAAIMNSKNSSPGVGNISNLVWKIGPPQFRSYLYDCLNSHLSGAPPPARTSMTAYGHSCPKGSKRRMAPLVQVSSRECRVKLGLLR